MVNVIERAVNWKNVLATRSHHMLQLVSSPISQFRSDFWSCDDIHNYHNDMVVMMIIIINAYNMFLEVCWLVMMMFMDIVMVFVLSIQNETGDVDSDYDDDR